MPHWRDLFFLFRMDAIVDEFHAYEPPHEGTDDQDDDEQSHDDGLDPNEQETKKKNKAEKKKKKKEKKKEKDTGPKKVGKSAAEKSAAKKPKKSKKLDNGAFSGGSDELATPPKKLPPSADPPSTTKLEKPPRNVNDCRPADFGQKRASRGFLARPGREVPRSPVKVKREPGEDPRAEFEVGEEEDELELGCPIQRKRHKRTCRKAVASKSVVTSKVVKQYMARIGLTWPKFQHIHCKFLGVASCNLPFGLASGGARIGVHLHPQAHSQAPIKS